MLDAPNMAIFCDFENVAIGAREAKFDDFDIDLVLERLLDKGRVLVKKAYCDWERYSKYRKAMHNAGFELIEVPHVSYSGKNSADIHMCVEALDLCYSRPHVDTFVIVSGDSDFSPLVRKLREYNKMVVGLGVKNSSSDLLIENCDDFIYYDDLVRKKRGKQRGRGRGKADTKTAKTGEKDGGKSAVKSAKAAQPKPAGPAASAAAGDATGSAAEALDLVIDTVETLLQERDGALWGSIVKQTIKRKKPYFDETHYGYRTFSDLLEDAQAQKLLELQLDEKSGGYIIAGLGPEA